jgi:hypothetical protein
MVNRVLVTVSVFMKAKHILSVALVSIQRDTIAQYDSANGNSFVVVGCRSGRRARQSGAFGANQTHQSNG